MALRNQPYLPLYVQDYLTDERVNMCSLSTQGVYIKLMCIMHKSEEYGTILLKQKDKQNESTCLNFALKVAKLLPIPLTDIHNAIKELLEEGVIYVEGDKLVQRRMVKDNAVSEARARSGKKGGEKTQKFAKAKIEANYENENENENKNIPTYTEFQSYAISKKPNVDNSALKLKYDSWIENGWKDGNDKKIINWKSKLLNTLPHIKESETKIYKKW